MFNFFDDISHFNGVANNGIFFSFFMLHDLKHGVFVEQLKILALSVSYLFLNEMFPFFEFSGFGSFFACEELFIGLLLLDFVAPVVHPLHPIKMRPWNESGFHLNSL